MNVVALARAEGWVPEMGEQRLRIPRSVVTAVPGDRVLDLLEALALDPALSGWDGLGFVIQTVQKRSPFVTDWVLDLGEVLLLGDGRP